MRKQTASRVFFGFVLGLILSIPAAVFLTMPGCASNTGGPRFVSAMDTLVNTTVGPRYIAYVNADPTLTPEQRAIYLEELRQARLAVDEANLAITPTTPTTPTTPDEGASR